MRKKLTNDIGGAIFAIAIGFIAFLVFNSSFPKGWTPNIANLGVGVGWGGALIVGMLGVAVVYRMLIGSIDLTKLVSEPNGDASMSRFQLLVFTFVIGLSLLLIVVNHPNYPAFPDHIPPEVLALLGISAGSYVVSKSLQNNLMASQALPTVTITPITAQATVGQSVTLTVNATGAGTLSYQWQRMVPGGSDWTPLSSQTSPTLIVCPTSAAEDGTQYRCTVSNPNGNAVSPGVTVTVVGDRG